MFVFRLALALGHTARELLEKMSSRELSEWLAYYGLEPFGDERADLRAGIISSTIANANSNHRFKPSDFMPDFRGRYSAASEFDPYELARNIQRTVDLIEAKKP
jgi:hypothetical protein